MTFTPRRAIIIGTKANFGSMRKEKQGISIMKRKQGFTLAELLIVVAIIAVLVAIAIPVFGGQVEKSKQAVDMANLHAAYAVLIADCLSGDAEAGKTYPQGQQHQAERRTGALPSVSQPASRKTKTTDAIASVVFS